VEAEWRTTRVRRGLAPFDRRLDGPDLPETYEIATSFTATNTSITALADWVSGQLGRPVLDRTGLAGAYDLNSRR